MRHTNFVLRISMRRLSGSNLQSRIGLIGFVAVQFSIQNWTRSVDAVQSSVQNWTHQFHASPIYVSELDPSDCSIHIWVMDSVCDDCIGPFYDRELDSSVLWRSNLRFRIGPSRLEIAHFCSGTRFWRKETMLRRSSTLSPMA